MWEPVEGRLCDRQDCFPQASMRPHRPLVTPALMAPRKSPATGPWEDHVLLCPTWACLTGAELPHGALAGTPGLAAEQPLQGRQTSLGT